MTPSNLFDEANFREFKNILTSRINDADQFQVDLERTVSLDLTTFNDLVKLYLKFKAFGKDVHYINLSNSIERFVHESKFSKPFRTIKM